MTAPRAVPILPTVSGGDGSLGDIRKALAGITQRLDALADAVGVASASTPPGVLLDELEAAGHKVERFEEHNQDPWSHGIGLVHL